MQDEMNDLQEVYTDQNPGDLLRIIRCADCIEYAEILPGTDPICLMFGNMKPDDYCSRGVRKDEG